jgi:formyl-CoA transferase
VVPFESFETSTGPIIVAAGNDRLFAKLAKVLGHAEWAADPKYATNAERVANKPALLAEIATIFATASRDAWIARLEAEGVPCAVINTLPEAASTKQAEALGIVQKPPGGDDYTLIGLPLSFDGARPPIHRAPPAPGQHTDEVRRERGGGGARPR